MASIRLAIVAVQLVGNAVSATLLGDIRSINGGDIHVSSSASPLSPADLAYFGQLQARGTIATNTAVDTQAVKLTVRGQTSARRFGLKAVDPTRFPVAGAPVFTTPTDGALPSLLQGASAVITTTLAQLQGLHVSDTVRMTTVDGRTGELTIRGVIESSGAFQGPVLLMDVSAYAALPNSGAQPLAYSDVYLDVPGHGTAQAGRVEQGIQQELPLAAVQTPDQLLATQQQQVDQIRYVIQTVRLLALLIGGVSDPPAADAQLDAIQRVAPSAWTFSVADTQAQVNDLLHNLRALLAIIGSLTMLAAIIGIANAVALALLERRRELGILKAVGFTGATVVGEVLVEHAVGGVIAGVLAVLSVCAVVPELGTRLFGQPFTVPASLAVAILLGAAAITMAVAGAVAWQPTRVRPLEVLRYE